MKSKIGIFIQARMGSTRLPGKIFKTIGGKSVLKILTDNIKKTEYKKNIYLLTTTNIIDDVVEKFARDENIKFFRGSEEDVLDRFFQASTRFKIDDVVRLTADCPFLSTWILDENIKGYYQNKRADYYFVKNYPVGLGAVEIMSYSAIRKAHKESTIRYHREHVMTYIVDNPDKFRIIIKKAPDRYNRPNIRLTLDEQKDLNFLRLIYQSLNGKIDLDNIFDLLKKNPQFLKINSDVRQKGQ